VKNNYKNPGRLLALFCTVTLCVSGVSTATAQIARDSKLLASDGESGDIFGSSTAMTEYTTVVGARHDDDNGTNSGSVYVYHRDGIGWFEKVKLVASDGVAGDRFGDFVAIDDRTLLIGSPGDRFSLTSPGAAYVYTQSGGNWLADGKLVASDGQPGDEFGRVAIEGDTAIISAPSDDDNGFDSGSVYVFKRIRDEWIEQEKLLASDGSSGDQFGRLAIDEDTIIVGAPRDDGIAVDTGSAYVFVRENDTWTEQARLIASDAAMSDRFGWTVAIDGDTAVIGAVGQDDNGINSGAAYIFTRDDGTWTEQTKLLASDGAANDGFGQVAISANKILIGAPRNSDNNENSSATYVFGYSNGTWAEKAKVVAGIGAANQAYGAPAIAGNTFVIGAGGNHDKGLQSGSAYIFSVVDVEFDGIIDNVDNCPTAFNPDQIDSNDDGFGDACVDPTVLVSADIDVDRTVTVGADAEFKKNVRLGAYTSVGSNVYLKNGVYVGEQVDIGDGARLNKDIRVGDAASIGAGVTIGRNTFVGRGTVIGANTTIGKDAVICAAAEIGANSEIGSNSFVSATTVLLPASVHSGIDGPAPDPADCS
jgi:carbonic anhydrase/acetyltransferase-like protein (isoleucine patch superfamily)